MAPLHTADRTWLCSVLFMDIVNYSSQSVEFQMKWKERFNGYLAEAIRDVPVDDRVILDTGDGAAICFLGPPEAAMFSALQLLASFVNNERDQKPGLRVRSGVNLGPVKLVKDINGNLNALGDGINDAQRIMSFARDNQILVSRSFFEVMSRLSDDYKRLFRLKGIERDKHVREHTVYHLLPPGSESPQGVEGESKSSQPPDAVLAPSGASAGISGAGPAKRKRHIAAWKLALFAGTIAIAAGVFFYSHRGRTLTEKDIIVLADFDNKSGDPVFDDALKQALAVDLEQSPFLNILSDRKVAAMLRLMGRSPDQPLMGEVALELCERVGSKAMLTGSISALGNNYVIGLNAINCLTGDALAKQQVEARGKEEVLKALGRAATEIRGMLGESLGSIQKFATPIEEATTPSLEALKAYSMGRRAFYREGHFAAIPYYERAADIDSSFAMAYRALASSYFDIGQTTKGSEYAKKAFELRERVSERERYGISASYYEFVTGELDKAKQAYELSKQSYPRDAVVAGNLGYDYMVLAQWEKALPEIQEANQLEPSSEGYSNLTSILLALNRTEDAQATLQKALALKLDSTNLRLSVYGTAFIRGDWETMRQQLAWGLGRSGQEDWLLSAQSDTEAYFGRLVNGRELSQRAVDSAVRAGAKETGALWQAEAALREAEFGNAGPARRDAMASLTLVQGRIIRSAAALALARAGDMPQAQKLADSLDRDFPQDTIIQGYWLPSIHAAIQIAEKNAAKAVEILKTAAPYELGMCEPFQLGMMYPVYLRGHTYLLARQGKEAAVEFQRIVNHRGIVLNFPLGALAYVGLGRAYTLQAETGKARAAYQNFLSLWKDADPDIPILKQVKAEYAKLQ